MTQQNDLILLVARAVMAVLFIMAGFGKLGDVSGFAGYMASGGVPAFLAWPVVLFEIIAGIALLAGFLTRPTALALAGFSLLAGLLYHFEPSDQGQMTHFLKNLALTGGYLAFFVTGAGRFSVDGLKKA